MHTKLPTSIIAKRLIRNVVGFAALLIVIATVIIGLITYFSEIRAFEQRFDIIHRSYLDVIRTALWVDDKENLNISLIGICRMPGIEYADIHSKDGIICKAGKDEGYEKYTRIYPIVYDYNGNTYELGKLHVKGSRDFVRQKIFKAVLVVMLTQAFTILVVCGLVLLLIYRIVIRRLLKITAYTSALSLDSLDAILVMDQQPQHPDELDNLADTINRMRENLHQAFDRKKAIEEQLKQHQRNLEKVVAQRTASLKGTNEKLQMEINERKKVEKEREKLIDDLQGALTEVRKLSGMLPICANCKKIRDDKGYWNQVESYIQRHSEAQFSHSICPDCVKKLYPDLDI